MHIMLDLETLGVNSNSVISAIGAVKFDPNTDEIGETFYDRVSPQSCVNVGLVMDVSTILWWMKQSEDARKSTFEGTTVSLQVALMSFHGYLGTNPKGVRVWGNGSDFDNVILGNAYHACHQPTPWSFGKNRCFRTVKNMIQSRDIILPPRKGTHHNALDDAVYQATCLQAITKANKIQLD